jgi:hypothetical protein
MAGLVSAGLLAISLSGCSEGANLPSIGGSTGTETDSERTARAYYDCLADVGLPASIRFAPNRRLTVVEVTGDIVLYNTPGVSGSIGAVDPATEAKFMAGDRNAYRLLINGADRSADFAACHESTGYREAEAWGLDMGLKVDWAWAAAVVEESNRWADCARDNGMVTVQDATMPRAADVNDTPMALLSVSITEHELRQLLKVCPNFYPDRVDRNKDILNENPGAQGLPSGYQVQPVVGFDYPDFDGHALDTQPVRDEAVILHLAQLRDILEEARTAYQALHDGD